METLAVGLGTPNAHFSAPDFSASIGTLQVGEFRLGPEVQWLWPGRIPRGMVTLIEGAEGAGKSFVVLDIAARVSRGSGWPGVAKAVSEATHDSPFTPGPSPTRGEESIRTGSESNRDVLILCRPDDCRSAGRRLEALGADFQRVRRLSEIDLPEPAGNRPVRRPLEFPADLPAIESELRRGTLGLVVIDSLADFCPLPQQVAETLRRLNELAEKHDVAIVVTLPAYCRCDGQGMLKVTSRYRTGGARCVWTILADPDVPARRVFVSRRTNFCEEPAGLEFRFDDGRIVWNPVPIEPTDPLGLQAGISLCLTEALRGGQRPAAEVLREGQQCGFSHKQLRSAAKRLGIETHKSSGFGADGGWTWWTAEQWAERVGQFELVRDQIVLADPPLQTDLVFPSHIDSSHIVAGASQAANAAADRSSSRLYVGPAWVNPDGTISQPEPERGKEMLARLLARAAARAQATAPVASVPPEPAAPQSPAQLVRTETEPARMPQAASSKNEESLEKQPQNERPAVPSACRHDGPLPRDGYARRQERKRRKQERDRARKLRSRR